MSEVCGGDKFSKNFVYGCVNRYSFNELIDCCAETRPPKINLLNLIYGGFVEVVLEGEIDEDLDRIWSCSLLTAF